MTFAPEVATAYAGRSQRIRVMSEHWAGRELSCPACAHFPLTRFNNNSRIADLQCIACDEVFELKSKAGSFSVKVVDGAYHTMMSRLSHPASPSLMLLSYDRSRLAVAELWVVPRFYFVPSMIEPRKPLSATARRAGWIGCNIRLDGIPAAGKIEIVHAGRSQRPEAVASKWSRSAFLATKVTTSRTWLIEVMYCIDRLNKATFTLAELYTFEPMLQARYPANENVRAKIRQQLQVLRDEGFVQFLGRGHYSM